MLIVDEENKPFSMAAWWPEVEESHYPVLIVLGVLLGLILVYFAF
jgi:hypothetical protein